MAGSFQNEIPPARINLKLDVGKGNAKKKIELPLKMLVVGDFSFKEKGDRVSDREKISINKDNFTQVMESMDLKLKYNVENKLTGQGDLQVDMGMKNKWDNGFVGNYYSDMGSKYYIPGGSGVDKHPLPPPSLDDS